MNKQIGWSVESNLLRDISNQMKRLIEVMGSIPPDAGGDMLKSVYDPTSVVGDAFDMDNMTEGADTKILTASERSAIVTNTAKISLEDNSVTEAKLAPQYKGSSVISALNVDWSASQTYTKPLTGNTVLTFSNLYIGIKSLVITGNYTLGFPTGFTLTIDSNAYDGTKVCLISVECWDTSTPVGLVHITYSV